MRLTFLALSALAIVTLAPSPAGAITLDGGCQGQAASFDGEHTQLMAATAPSAEPGTSANPFLADSEGTVEYAGTGPLLSTYHYEIKVFGITVKSGDGINAAQQSAVLGVVDLRDYAPFKVTGVYFVEGELTGPEGACSGSAFVKLVGSPVGTIPWIVAVGLIVVGTTLLYSSFPRARPRRLGVEGVNMAVFTPSSPPRAPQISVPLEGPIAEPLTTGEQAPFAPTEPTEPRRPIPPPPPPGSRA